MHISNSTRDRSIAVANAERIALEAEARETAVEAQRIALEVEAQARLAKELTIRDEQKNSA